MLQRNLKDRASVEDENLPVDSDRYRGDLAHLRMAAMLHDVGHGLCSHASEQIYALLSDLREFEQNPEYARNAPGEILSYLMVTSDVFRNWFNEHVVKNCQAKLDLDIIGNLILGKTTPDKWFLAQIISSAYDCDKLDYIARDSYYCGLALTVDLPRFYSMISTANYNNHRVLVLRSYVPLEQILFSKMTLFGSVYHHQKVKCIDSMLRSIVQHVVENPDQAAINIRGTKITFSDPVQYLYVTDEDFFGQTNEFGDTYVKEMLNRFRSRNLFVRCLEISRRTVTNWQSYGRQSLVELSELPEKLEDVERDIHKALPSHVRGSCNRYDIRLSIPGLPGFKPGNALIQTSRGSEIENIQQYFPLEQWTDAYAHNKWRSFVYAPLDRAAAVRDAAIAVIHERCKLDIDRKKSDQTCHL